MLRFLRLCLTAFCTAVLFAGCCANSVCDCQDGRADAIYFRFLVNDTAPGTQAFLSSEVDTVWILRYNRPQDMTTGTRRDSVSFVRNAAQAAEPIVLNNNAPFAPVSGRKLHEFDYDILFVDRNLDPQRFQVRKVQLDGSFEGDGCCTCYVNSRKAAEVNGRLYEVSETDQQPVYITLTR